MKTCTRGLHLGHMYYCSNCGKLAHIDNYCSLCGAITEEYAAKLKLQTQDNFVTVENDLFTPEQVRKMTQEEVRKNYHKIRESMKYWD